MLFSEKLSQILIFLRRSKFQKNRFRSPGRRAFTVQQQVARRGTGNLSAQRDSQESREFEKKKISLQKILKKKSKFFGTNSCLSVLENSIFLLSFNLILILC